MSNFIRKILSAATWTLFRIPPIKNNKIVFSSFNGKGYGGNPKAIAEALLALDKDHTLDLVWLTQNKDTPLPDRIRPCRTGTPQSVYELSTARVWVNDSRSGALYKRGGQFYMQTWHGFAQKHIERAVEAMLPRSYVKQCKRDSAFTDVIISGSGFMTELHKRDFWYSGDVAEYGTPRCDIFFCDNAALRARVADTLLFPCDRKLCLYAPTFRDDHSIDAYKLDVKDVLQALRARFGGEWSLLVRLHPNVASQSATLYGYDGDTAVDVTSYPDMQELLASVDVLITDYSSSMFDFALSGKPCLLFATDIPEYSSGRGFYFPIDSLPFPLARSMTELTDNIRNYAPDKSGGDWCRFYNENGFCEDGGAAHRCALLILDHIR